MLTWKALARLKTITDTINNSTRNALSYDITSAETYTPVTIRRV